MYHSIPINRASSLVHCITYYSAKQINEIIHYNIMNLHNRVRSIIRSGSDGITLISSDDLKCENAISSATSLIKRNAATITSIDIPFACVDTLTAVATCTNLTSVAIPLTHADEDHDSQYCRAIVHMVTSCARLTTLINHHHYMTFDKSNAPTFGLTHYTVLLIYAMICY
jgi:methionyl-tRNA synthetase